LGALFLHAGRFEEAAAELGAYSEARRGRRSRGGGGAAEPPSSSSRLAGVRRPWEGGAGASASSTSAEDARWDTAFEAALADRLLAMARGGGGGDGQAAVITTTIPPPLSVERVLRGDFAPAATASGAASEPQRHTW